MDVDRQELLNQVRARIAADLEAVTGLQQQTQAGATHEEAKPESDKDTRAIEASYLARGLAERVSSLRTASARLQRLRVREFGDSDAIGLTALVALEADDGTISRYFILPAGAGIRLTHAGHTIAVVTSESPVGQALLGRYCDDEIRLPGRGGARVAVIVSLS